MEEKRKKNIKIRKETKRNIIEAVRQTSLAGLSLAYMQVAVRCIDVYIFFNTANVYVLNIILFLDIIAE